jgi:preprotein translocase subunit SecG
MSNVLLVIHILVALALIGVVLVQRNEGGGLGIGGGGGGGGMSGFMTGRSAANFLTRITAILAAIFMVTSIVLTILMNQQTSSGGGSLVDQLRDSGTPGATTGEGATPSTGGGDQPAGEATPAPAPAPAPKVE